MNSTAVSQQKSIVLLGASFSTGNLGVSALAWSSIKIIRAKWPNCIIVLVGADRRPGVVKIKINGSEEVLFTWPVRYCANIFTQYHIFWLGLTIFLYRFLPFLKKHLTRNRATLGELLRCDLVCDITGGDSFSDIYGFSRLFKGYLLKRVCQMTDKPFILLPQTYGPFSTPLARFLARGILRRSDFIYSRDLEGTKVVEELIGTTNKLKLCPDVAFAMDVLRPDTLQTTQLEELKADHRLIGLNISGLLYSGGYTQNNMFGLSCNYPSLVRKIILFFIRQPESRVLLVPHVLPREVYALEDDLIASQKALRELPIDVMEKVILLDKGYGQNETKYLIGLCDFFLGARMHATIAALSQEIPAVGLAYSKKFTGVFETADVADCVLDLRRLDNQHILHGIKRVFAHQEEIRSRLKRSIPEIKDSVFNIFNYN